MLLFSQASGEAQEVLSLRQGPVKTLRVLPTPEHVYDGNDLYKYKRPLVAICDTTRFVILLAGSNKLQMAKS